MKISKWLLLLLLNSSVFVEFLTGKQTLWTSYTNWGLKEISNSSLFLKLLLSQSCLLAVCAAECNEKSECSAVEFNFEGKSCRMQNYGRVLIESRQKHQVWVKSV